MKWNNESTIPANFFWDIGVRRPKYKCEFAPSAFHFKNQRLRGRYCHFFILHMVFVPYMGLTVNMFLEIVSSKTATTHIFQSGVRNWPASVSQREIEVLNPQAWDPRLRRESWQVYNGSWRIATTCHHLPVCDILSVRAYTNVCGVIILEQGILLHLLSPVCLVSE